MRTTPMQVVCGDEIDNTKSLGLSKCVVLTVSPKDTPRLFETPSLLPADMGGLLLYQHREPYDFQAEMSALRFSGPHLVRRWGACDLVNSSTVK
jgi:hypothetical protein